MVFLFGAARQYVHRGVVEQSDESKFTVDSTRHVVRECAIAKARVVASVDDDSKTLRLDGWERARE
jgi:hypothetical protein